MADKWQEKSGVDEEKAKQFEEGMRRRAEDNPINNAYKWLKKKAASKNEQDQES